MQDVVQRRRRVFGPAHPDTINSEKLLRDLREELILQPLCPGQPPAS